MVELRSWFVARAGSSEDEYFYLNGVVNGHTSPRCKDGTYIHTSMIMSIADKGDTLEFCTRNTVYTLNKRNIAANTGLSDESQKDVLFSCFSSNMGDSGNAAAQELLHIIKEKRQRTMEKAEALGSEMFWLELSADCEYYFDQAYFKSSSGELHREDKLVHVGTFQDSVILKECDLRYFPYQKNSLKFYHTLYEMLLEESETPNRLLGYIYNSGSTPLRVKFTWGKTIEIKPGETVPFDKAELEKYPDSELLSHDDLYPAMDISSLQNKS